VAKNVEGCFLNLNSIFILWLYLSVDNRHFGYTTKLPQKKKKTLRESVGEGGGGGVARHSRRTRRTHSSAAASDGRLSNAAVSGFRRTSVSAGVCLADGTSAD
jgi:hypothetical protein